MKLLIVDDEKDIRDSLEEFFVDEGYQVRTAANGEEALTAMKHERPCIVILDLRMPVKDGNEVYEAMQRDEKLATLPVVVSTSDPSSAPSGVLIMKKPINLSRLLEVVKRSCAGEAGSARA